MKKFFSAILLMTIMVFSVSTFVSCNDQLAEIEKVQEQVGANADAIDDLDKAIKDLETAYKAADTELKNAVGAAAEAAAQAKLDAIDRAQQLVNDLKTEIEGKGYATTAALDEAINAIKASLNLKADASALTELAGTVGGINTQVAAIENYLKLDPTTKEFGALKEITDALQAAKAAIWGTLPEGSTSMSALKALIEGNTTEIGKIWAAINDPAEGLDKINDRLGDIEGLLEDEVKGLDAIWTKIGEIDEQLNVVETNAHHILKSLAYIPNTIDGQLNEIEDDFVTIKRLVEDKTFDEAEYEYATANCVQFSYQVNPTTMAPKISHKDLQFVALDVLTKAEGDESVEVEVEKFLDVYGIVDGESVPGVLLVNVKPAVDLPTYEEAVAKDAYAKLAALKYTNVQWGEAYSIVSDYVAVVDQDIKNFVIKNPMVEAGKGNTYFQTEWWNDEATPYANDKFYEETENVGKPVELIYNGSLNLNDYVYTYSEELKTIDEEGVLDTAFGNVDVTYEFDLVDEYKVGDKDQTDQQKFVSLDDKGNLTVVKKWGENESQFVAIGKTPVVAVVAKADGVEIAKAYIKVKIVKADTTPVSYTKPDTKVFHYTELPTSTAAPWFSWEANDDNVYPACDFMTWEEITTNVLAKKGIDLPNYLFATVYDVKNATFKATYTEIDGEEVEETEITLSTPVNGTAMGAGIILTTTPEDASSTYTAWAGYAVNALIHENCAGKVSITIKPNADENYTEFYPEITLVFKFKVDHDPRNIFPAFRAEYNETEIVTVKGHDVNGAYNFEAVLKEAFEDVKEDGSNICGANHSPIAFRLAENETRAELSAAAPAKFADAKNYNWTEITINLKNGAKEDVIVEFNGSNYAEAGTKVEEPSNLVWDDEYMDIPVTMYTILENGNECSRDYTVRFYNPFAAELADITIETVEETTTIDVLKNLKVTYQGKEIYKNAGYVGDAEETTPIYHQFSIVGSEIPASFKEQNRLVWDLTTITWNNGGSVLHETYKFDVALYVYNQNVGWFPIKASEDKVTVEKTPVVE